MANNIKTLSNVEYAILDLLRTGQEKYGLEMVKESNGALKRGTIYVTLSRMVDKGYVTFRHVDNPNGAGPQRCIYQIAGLGRRILLGQEQLEANIRGAFDYGYS